MKISTSNQYTSANSVLIFIVSILLGYNIYQAICHPEKSDLFICIILVALTSVTVQKYGTKADQKKKI
ncbi:hypothetical protein BBH99_03455 [Chryseobacterium contaminans]|uniref:Uncharacterized protein n=1 Tax=Chryseobacterium contaminans TaxID=1423959 RepID=A0A1M6VES4_9FLAO|nr:hypothetical protein [Chryseobacterium contaminans]OCA71103.1 hypothetical protein BBH99_03455 [Chryseobacterium contaminans]SHK79949.1 hypothetical protein SAMN05444407_101183 [Chryseobacterium contaminans]